MQIDSNRRLVSRQYWGDSSRIVLIAEVLLLFLAVLSMQFPGVDNSERVAIQMAILLYAAWVAVQQYVNNRGLSNFWIVAVRTWAMFPLIVWVMMHTDGLVSPLRNGFLLAVLASALTVGTVNTMFLVVLWALNTVYLNGDLSDGGFLSLSYFGEFITRMTPQILTAYVMALFGSEFRYLVLRKKLVGDKLETTGLLSTKGFAILVDRLRGRVDRESIPVGVLVLAIENIAAIAGQRGAKEAENLFRTVSGNVVSELRQGDLAVRYSERSILILLPEVTAQHGSHLAVRVMHKIDAALAVGGTSREGNSLSCRTGSIESSVRNIEDMLDQIEILHARQDS